MDVTAYGEIYEEGNMENEKQVEERNAAVIIIAKVRKLSPRGIINGRISRKGYAYGNDYHS